MDAAGLFCRFALAAHFCVLGALPLIALGKSSSLPSLPSLAVTGGVASLQLLGGLAIAAPGGELCGGVMLVAYQVLAAYEVLPALTLPVDPAAWAPFLRELALLGAIGLVFGYALERKRSKTAVPAGGSKKTA